MVYQYSVNADRCDIVAGAIEHGRLSPPPSDSKPLALSADISRRHFFEKISAIGLTSIPASVSAAFTGLGIIDDLMPRFFAAYDKSASLTPMINRIKIMAVDFFLPNADIYTKAGFNGGDHGRLLDSIVADWLTKFDPISNSVRTLSKVAPRAWRDEQYNFKTNFKDFRFSSRAAFMVSLFSFNAMTRGDNSKPTVFFGLDTLAQQGGTVSDMAVTMAHEIAHLYQAQVAQSTVRPELWARLWSEGLATYASHSIHPEASAITVYMSNRLASATDNQIAESAKIALTGLDEIGGPVSHSLLDRQDNTDSIDRLGYLLGARSVSQAVEKRPLADIFRSGPGEAKSFIISTLSELASR